MNPTNPKNSIASGDELIELIEVLYKAEISFKLEGDHGIGKTECIAAAAKKMGIGFISVNLAAMEPADLQGYPVCEGDQFRYVLPPWLLRVSTDARGGLVLFDEINRLQRFMLAPLHQILTDRSINGVSFQRGWLVCAAANTGAAYDVVSLDPAMESRFLTMHVVATVASWVKEAARRKLDRRVLDFVSSTPDIFTSSSPRQWTNVAKLLRVADSVSPQLHEKLMAGLVGEAFSTAFTAYLASASQHLKPTDILAGSDWVIDRLRDWRDRGNVALLLGSARLLQAHLQSQAIYDALSRTERRNALAFVRGLPAELRKNWNAWATKCDYHMLIVSNGRAR